MHNYNGSGIYLTLLYILDIFSLFAAAASDLKKAIENEQLKHQYGTKSAGAETVIHIFQQTMAQNTNYDIFSADAIEAFYNLNRDTALKKLKEVAPQYFNLFMDKYNDASNAFFFGLSKGVASFTQAEGGSPGSPEMSFLYELGISEFVKSIDDLMFDSNACGSTSDDDDDSDYNDDYDNGDSYLRLCDDLISSSTFS